MKKTILLVEDEAIIALNQKKIIEKYGFTVIPVTNGESAIKEVNSDPEIALVLMDIDLGDGLMDGTEAAQIILLNHNLPVVFLSGHTEEQIVEKTENISSYGYVVKNSGEHVLITSIKMALRLHKSKLEAEEHHRRMEEAYAELEMREERLRQLNRVLLSIRRINKIITGESDRTSLLDKTCRLLIETNGYRKSWIILTSDGMPVEPFFHAGFGGGFAPMTNQLRVQRIPECAEKALLSDEPVVTETPGLLSVKCSFAEAGFSENEAVSGESNITTRIKYENRIFGWLSVIVPEQYAKDPEELGLFSEIAGDIAFALYSIELREMEGENEDLSVEKKIPITQSSSKG